MKHLGSGGDFYLSFFKKPIDSYGIIKKSIGFLKSDRFINDTVVIY